MAGRAGNTDGLSLLDIGAYADLDTAHVGVQRSIAGAVGNDHIVAVGAGALCHNDRTRLGGVNRTGVAHPANIRSLVVRGTSDRRKSRFRRLADVVPAGAAAGAGHGTLHSQ